MDSNDFFPFLFLDLETTGHEPLKRFGDALYPWHEIIEIGGVIARQPSLEVIKDFHIYVRPEHPERGDPKAYAINHYPERAAKGEWDNAMILDTAIRLMFANVKSVTKKITKCVLFGQNFTFDWRFLGAAFDWCDITEGELDEFFDYGRLDTRSQAVGKFLRPGQPYVRQDYSMRSGLLQKKLGLPPEPLPHTALNGAYQVYRAFKKLRDG